MKIGYYTTYLPPYPGGMEVVAFQLARHMALKGHEVTVFTSSLSSKDSYEQCRNMTIFKYKANFTIASAPFCFNMFLKPMKKEFDIIHAHLAAPTAALAGLWHAKLRHIPFILGYSGDLDASFGAFVRRASTLFYNTFLHHKLLSSADIIISPTECYVKNSKFLGKYRDKTIAIAHGIVLEDFHVPYSKAECREKLSIPINFNLILFLGQLSPHKGPDVLLRAIPEIIKRNPNVETVFVGTGPLLNKLERLAHELSVNNCVRFVGYVDDSLKALFYHASDIFVLPSTTTSESFGVVNLEAMACGLPIIASNIGGIPDVVKDGENGLLVPPKDPKALAEATVRLLEDEHLRRRFSKNGREKVRMHSWPKIAEETERIYRKVLSTKR